jgi:glycosyltransferase involved in cell wall biosynthesis
MREVLRVSGDDIVIGHIGGMIPERDQETLIRAFGSIHSDYRHTKLVLIGDGPLRAHLESLSRSLGIERAVVFTGYTDRVGDYLAAMDMYVNPTLDEGFGIAVVEAMLARLPVILSDRGAHPELIVDGESGVIFTGGDADQLRQSIARLINRPGQRSEIGRKAYERGQASFSVSTHVNRMMSLVEDVLKGSKSVTQLSQMKKRS